MNSVPTALTEDRPEGHKNTKRTDNQSPLADFTPDSHVTNDGGVTHEDRYNGLQEDRRDRTSLDTDRYRNQCVSRALTFFANSIGSYYQPKTIDLNKVAVESTTDKRVYRINGYTETDWHDEWLLMVDHLEAITGDDIETDARTSVYFKPVDREEPAWKPGFRQYLEADWSNDYTTGTLRYYMDGRVEMKAGYSNKGQRCYQMNIELDHSPTDKAAVDTYRATIKELYTDAHTEREDLEWEQQLNRHRDALTEPTHTVKHPTTARDEVIDQVDADILENNLADSDPTEWTWMTAAGEEISAAEALGEDAADASEESQPAVTQEAERKSDDLDISDNPVAEESPLLASID